MLYTNEENGLRGGLDYRTRYQAALDRHVLMIESDVGVAAPPGFGFSGNDTARAQVVAIASLLGSIGATHVGPSGGGADIGPSVAAGRIPAMSPEVDSSKYFLIHHTEADTVDRIDPTDLAKHVAALAVMAYVVADMPQRFGEAQAPTELTRRQDVITPRHSPVPIRTQPSRSHQPRKITSSPSSRNGAFRPSAA